MSQMVTDHGSAVLGCPPRLRRCNAIKRFAPARTISKRVSALHSPFASPSTYTCVEVCRVGGGGGGGSHFRGLGDCAPDVLSMCLGAKGRTREALGLVGWAIIQISPIFC